MPKNFASMTTIFLDFAFINILQKGKENRTVLFTEQYWPVKTCYQI